ncbi:hypothetical protein [Trebonia sp.]|uniref:hypothetical protein n=1 Tax=Trebonia sp. TaxID=2767075 RepID=UPI002624C0B1|nr:hypothetical protein [Trebonia sp.]
MSAVHGLWQGLAAVAVGAAAGVLVAYMSASAPHVAPAHAAGAAPRGTSTVIPLAKPFAYELYTRCGIDEARIGNTYFEAVHPPGGGTASPPAGWGNPYQAGTMTLLSATEAVFTDRYGHRVVFRAHPGAATSRHGCS